MILKNATIKYKGYDPDTLSFKSTLKICCACDECGKVRYVSKQGYKNLCNSCKQIGDKNPMYNIHRYGKDAPHYGHICSNETKKKMSKVSIGISKSKEHKNNISNNHADFNGDKNPNWKGGLPLRDHVKPSNQCLKINNWFEGCEGHHILTGVIIYISKNIHRSISHNMKNGKNMNEINKLALQFINGEI